MPISWDLIDLNASHSKKKKKFHLTAESNEGPSGQQVSAF